MTSPGTEEVGARLRLRDRAQFQRDAQGAARDVRNIGDASEKAGGSGKFMGAGMSIARAGVGGLASAARLGITAVGGLALGVGALAVKTVGLAMDAGETQSKFSTVFKGMESDVSGFVTQMSNSFGIPKKELQDAVAGFGIFAKAAGVPKAELAGFSKDLTTAGMDLASFYNADQGEVFSALKSGLAGEAEPLKAFGIFMSDATMKAEAASMGLRGELTEGQKVMVRQSLILKGLGDAQGDLARTSGGLANQFKGLKGRFTEVGTLIGQALLPVALRLVSALNDRLGPIIAKLTEQLPNLMGALAAGDLEGAATVIDNIAGNTGKWTGTLWRLMEGIKGAWGALSAGDLGGAVANIDLATGAGGRLSEIFRIAKPILEDIVTLVKDALAPAAEDGATGVLALATQFGFADDILGVFADNADLVRIAITAYGIAMAVSSAYTQVHAYWTALSNGYMVARTGITMLLTGQTGLAAAAELTRNQALAASIGMHARLGAIMIWTGIKAVASMIASVAVTVGGWILMGVTAMANAVIMAAAWVIGLGPIGWAIGLLVLMGIAFAVLWRKSETFRNIVKGALAAVGSAAVAAKDWIVSAFNTTVGFLAGLPGRISSATSGMWNGIKSSFRSALNFIIDGWNGLSFSIPSVDTKIPGIGKVGGMTFGTPDIPRLHQGGTTTGAGSAIIQADEELVVLPPAASVIPLDNAPAVAAATGGSSGPITLQVVLDRRVLAEAVYDHTGDKVARR